MPLILSPLLPEEAPEYTRIRLLAFVPLNQIKYVLSPTRTASAATQARITRDLANDITSKPNVHLLKVQDSATGDILAIARWGWRGPSEEEWEKGRRERTSEEVEEGLKPLKREDMMEETDPRVWWGLVGMLQDTMREVMGKRPYWKLEVLITDPVHQRRGAGTMLIQWGIDQAEKKGVECYLEASPIGRPLYERFGFKSVKAMPLNLADYGEGYTGGMTHHAMVRQPTGRGSATEASGP